jgi:hypothetical protein
MNETHYVVVENGVVVNRVVSKSALEPNWFASETAQIGWTYDGINFIRPPYLAPTLTWIITKVAFVSRFTSAEYVGVVTAANSDPSVQAWYDLLFIANNIDLEDQRTVDGINFMVSKNLLTAERANEILTTPSFPSERP